MKTACKRLENACQKLHAFQAIGYYAEYQYKFKSIFVFIVPHWGELIQGCFATAVSSSSRLCPVVVSHLPFTSFSHAADTRVFLGK